MLARCRTAVPALAFRPPRHQFAPSYLSSLYGVGFIVKCVAVTIN